MRVNSIRADLTLILDSELIHKKIDKNGNPRKKDGFPIYEKYPLARTVSVGLFEGTGKRPAKAKAPKLVTTQRRTPKKQIELSVPSEQEILDICKHDENQISEFKGQGVDTRKITKEIAAMLHTRKGGQIFYGVDDEGTIEGSDLSLQKFDQKLQNSIRNTMDPPATVKINQVSVLGSNVIVVTVPPWNKKDVYHYEGRVLIRKGTNAFHAIAAESKKLHKGQYVD